MSELRTVPWYDRNPVSVQLSYNGTSIGPHAAAQRDIYTTPQNKNAFIMGAFAEISRETAASDLRPVIASVGFQNGFAVRVELLDKTVSAKISEAIGLCGVLLQGEACAIVTSDASADGTCDYSIAANIMEFDAFPIEARPFEVEFPKEDVQEPKEPWWWPF